MNISDILDLSNISIDTAVVDAILQERHEAAVGDNTIDVNNNVPTARTVDQDDDDSEEEELPEEIELVYNQKDGEALISDHYLYHRRTTNKNLTVNWRCKDCS